MNRIMTQKGFTLVELLIVLALMALIATIAFPFLTGIQESFKYKADAITAETLAKQVQLQIQAGRLSDEPIAEITSADLGESLPNTKLEDGLWVVNHDGSTIKVLYDRDGNQKRDAKEPYAERKVIKPIE